MLENILANSYVTNLTHETNDLVKLLRSIKFNETIISLDENQEYLTKIPASLKDSKHD